MFFREQSTETSGPIKLWNFLTRSAAIAFSSWTLFCVDNYLLTYLLTPWSGILLEKLTGSQLVKKFPVFYGTRKSITTFTSARHLSLSWATLIQSMPPHPISWRSVLIVSSHLCLGLPSGFFPSGFPSNILCTSLLSPICATCPRPSHSSQFDHLNNTGWGVQIFKFLIMESSTLPCYLVPLRPKYSPQHLIYGDSKVKR